MTDPGTAMRERPSMEPATQVELPILACAITCGMMVGSLYFAQPIIDLIAPDLGIGNRLAGLIVTLNQVGYGVGLLLIVPLADMMENRRLILASLFATAAALAGLAFAPSAATFLAISVALGFCAAGAQVVVPYIASLALERSRGVAIGKVMGGLLAGIMLARPIASLVAEAAGWRAVFYGAAGVMLLIGGWLAIALHRRPVTSETRYVSTLRSLWAIFRDNPLLQRRAMYQGMAFAAFNVFWTTVPLTLGRTFGYTQIGIAAFALVGAAGALAAPLAGRLADQGHVRLGTGLALATIAVGFVVAGASVTIVSVALLAVMAIAIDAATQVNQVLGQHVINSLDAAQRGRLNALYMTGVFLLGAGGSLLATWVYAVGGWWAAALTGSGLAVIALAVFATERRARS
jgi:predicted MFS family arabinose efflux permease